MRTSERINGFWSLARERSAEGERLRRRIVVFAAMSLAVCGFLTAIGLVVVVLAFLVLALAAGAIVALTPVLPRLWAAASNRVRRLTTRGRAAGAAVVPLARRARGSSATALSAARTHGSALAQNAAATASKAHGPSKAALASARARSLALAHAAVESGSRTGRELAQRAQPTRRGPDPGREALRLNAQGAQRRREGKYDEAADCHRRALEILRELDDRRAVALTQSNLALALSHSGDDDWAIGLFEEAAATLRELGDEEHEGQIMANLGLAHRRQGRTEEGNNVLELALSKLTPASSAYQAVEEQLRRAS